jgi:hypothetical protein
MARIFADHMIPRDVSFRLRSLGHDVVASRDLGLDSFRDDVQFLAAATSRRTLISHDVADFEKLHDAWRRWSDAWGVAADHAGILILPQGWPHQRTANEIHRFLESGVDLTTRLFRLRTDGRWYERPLRAAPMPAP